MSNQSELLLEDGPEFKRLRISLSKFKDTPLLDLRYWYKDKSSGEFKPTSKGISLTRANYLGLRSVAIDHHDAIMDFLDVSSVYLAHTGDKNESEKSCAHRQESITEVITNTCPLKPFSMLYDIEYKGSLAHVHLNSNHPFVKGIAETSNSIESLQIVSMLLVSFNISLLNMSGTELTLPNILAEQFSFDFDKNIKKMSRSIK